MNKFEVGDKVKVVKLDTKWTSYVNSLNKYLGEIGTIDRVYGTVSRVIFKDDYWSFKNDWLELVEKKKKKKGWNGKIVCVNKASNCFNFFTIGKIYEVRDGMLLDDDNDESRPYVNRNQIKKFEDIAKLVDSSIYSFIEFKGFANTGKDKNE